MRETCDILQALASGKAEFMGREFFVEKGVLVPRPVTEVLIRACCTVFEGKNPRCIVDLGCGCGIIGVTLALAFPEARVLALDVAPEAVRVTQRNIEKWGLTTRMEARQSDMFAAVSDLVGQVDAVVSSPPFISNVQLAKGSAHLLELEPRAAFDAGPYGISIHQRLVKEGAVLLRPELGWLIVEFGQGQDRQVRRLVERAGSYHSMQEFCECTGQFIACIAARHGLPARE